MPLAMCRRTILAWQLWLSRRRLHRAYPDLARIEREISARRKRHARVADLQARQRAMMTAALRREA